MVWEWLITSLDATRGHEISLAQAWHGRFMVLAWGICAPLGILIARYLKVTPKQHWPEELDNKFWWYSHLTFQSAAVAAMLIGFCVLYFNRTGTAPESLHAWFGWGIILGTIAQVLSGLLRGTKGGPDTPLPNGSPLGDHYAMTKRRRVFERFHKLVGYCLLLSAIFVLLQGLWILNAPRWMVLVLLVFWAGLFTILRLLAPQPNLTSYQAIWGPSPSHPGNTTHRS